MARKKYEFQPDKPATGLWDKLYLTARQRTILLKWVLHALVLLVLLLLQDVILCRMDVFGGTTDLVPGAILMLTVILGAQTGSVFSLVAAVLYQFASSGPGYYVIALLPVLGIGVALFRQVFLRKGLSATFLCAGAAIFAYEAALFLICVVTGTTALFRWASFLSTAVMTVLCSFALYPLFTAIEKIGGESWSE